jgi:hypothetical protein
MRVFFGGAEKGTQRRILERAGVTRFGVNLTHFPIPKTKELVLSEVVTGEVILYTSEGDEDNHRFDEFVRQHEHSITAIIGRPEYDGAWLGEKYIPVWSDGEDLERLAIICQRHGRVAISDKAVNGKTIPRIRSLAQRWNADLYGLTSKPDVIEALPWHTVIVGSWTSALRYGETQVWDGHGLRRYPAQQKESSRKKHRADIMRLGLNPDLVLADDTTEVGMLAIRSWQAWESRVYDPPKSSAKEAPMTNSEGEIITMTPAPYGGEVGVPGVSSIAMTPPEKRHENERLLLPVIGVESITAVGTRTGSEQDEQYEIDPEEIPVIRHTNALLRQCDNCYLASKCPAYKERSECGFNLPVEIRTKDQLQATLRALLEMQVSRVLFARFAEEMEGQGLDSTLSTEIDRMFNLVNKFKDISDTRDVIRMEVEARGSAGVLSRLFGQKAGETARELSSPLPPQVMDNMAMDIINYEED